MLKLVAVMVAVLYVLSEFLAVFDLGVSGFQGWAGRLPRLVSGGVVASTLFTPTGSRPRTCDEWAEPKAPRVLSVTRQSVLALKLRMLELAMEGLGLVEEPFNSKCSLSTTAIGFAPSLLSASLGRHGRSVGIYPATMPLSKTSSSSRASIARVPFPKPDTTVSFAPPLVGDTPLPIFMSQVVDGF